MNGENEDFHTVQLNAIFSTETNEIIKINFKIHFSGLQNKACVRNTAVQKCVNK